VLSTLSQRLASAVSRLVESSEVLGKPELVERAADEAAVLFQKSAKALPSKEDAHSAAIALLQAKLLDERQLDLIAGVLCDPLPEYKGAIPLGREPFWPLLETYRAQADSDDLPRLTWYGLLCSYFKFNPGNAQAWEISGWKALRGFLRTTWPLIDRKTGTNLFPDWVKVLRADPDLLGNTAAARYALEYLRGNEEPTQALAHDLAIPESSWFWQTLVLAAVEGAARASDDQFKGTIPKLLGLIHERPVYRDEALISLLTRYHGCTEKPIHAELRDYVVRKDVWRNPKLKAAGLATTWNRVSDAVWRMVLSWVNESNLRDFFGILASRNHADEGRLEFWTKYLNQISWTRLIFGPETMKLARRNSAIAELIAREEGAYAQLLVGTRESDAFMMQIGEHIIVEFSITGNAAYVYPSEGLRFDRHAPKYAGNASDLKYGFNGGAKARIVHKAPWEQDAAADLKRLGIYPDTAAQAKRAPAAPFVAKPSPPPNANLGSATGSARSSSAAASPQPVSSRAPSSQDARPGLLEAPRGAPFKMAVLAEAVRRFEGAYIDDRRRADGGGGRLWVENPKQNVQCEKVLKAWGFVWAESRQAYYFPEKS
jgi:hypothetical protein